MPRPRLFALRDTAARLLPVFRCLLAHNLMKKRLLLLLITTAFCTLGAYAQQPTPAGTASPADTGTAVSTAPAKRGSWAGRTLRNLIADTTEEGKRAFRAYPTIGFAPETSLEIGFSGLLLYNAKGDTQNRISEVNAFTFVTLQAQYGFWLDHALYGDRDKVFFLGRFRAQRFPLLYWGIGARTPEDDEVLIDASYLLLRERVLFRIAPNLFVGPEGDVQWLINPEFEDRPERVPLPAGADGTFNLGFGAGIVYDDRHNVLNVRDGHFAELSFLDYRPAWGSEYRFDAITLDARAYRPLGERNVVAAQVFANYLTGDEGQVPFNQMAQLGGDMIMRGYYAGRYRDRMALSAQVEHRWLPFRFSKRFGGAVFAAAGVVAPELRSVRAADIKPAGGLGLRYALFPKKDIFLRFDVGVTQSGFNFYIYTGEAF